MATVEAYEVVIKFVVPHGGHHGGSAIEVFNHAYDGVGGNDMDCMDFLQLEVTVDGHDYAGGEDAG